MKKIILVAAIVGLSACQTAAPTYQAASGPNSPGYFSAPADDGRQTVIYTGQKGMSAAQVAEFAMLRAAELTLASGQQWFAVIGTTTQEVQVGDINRIDGRSGAILGSESTTAGSGGDRSEAAPGVRDSAVPGGPTTGGFGGGDVPYQVIERWTPPTVNQTALVIQMGSGNQASFEGLETAPEIFSAQAVADEIRAKMAK